MKSIQYRLNEGETPSEIVNSGVAEEELYGKNYQGGLIFYLNTAEGTGMIAAPEDANLKLKWEDAKKYCEDLEVEGYKGWFLPTKKVLALMYTNLHDKGHGGFAADWYWSSTENDNNNAWNQNFNNGNQKQNEVILEHKPTRVERDTFLSSMNSYLGILKHYKTYHLRKKMLWKYLSGYWWNIAYLSGGYAKFVWKKKKSTRA